MVGPPCASSAHPKDSPSLQRERRLLSCMSKLHAIAVASTLARPGPGGSRPERGGRSEIVR